MTITELTKVGSDSRQLVDIVAIHGIYEDAIQTWTEPKSSILWLRDLLVDRLQNVRVLIFSYKAASLTSPGEGTADRILAHATSLVSELCAERQFDNAFDRPIIFVCHGVGGLLAKRALAFSHSRRDRRVEHLHSIYTSTYGVIFLGTPHNGINKEVILRRQEGPLRGPSQFIISLLKGSEMLNEINDQFAPLMKQFSVYNFWEMLETEDGDDRMYIVDQDSAAPVWDNVEKCGIMGTHSTMAKFESNRDKRFRPLLEAICRFAKAAPTLIRTRWVNEKISISRERQQQAEELLRPQIQLTNADDAGYQDFNQWCMVPRRPSMYFTGRQKHAKTVRDMLGPVERVQNRKNNIVFVIYGLGGSGKTQFCLKYVEDNKHKYWGVFWVDASSEKNIESGFASIGAEAGRGANMYAGMYWLSRSTRPWLLILDNADNEEMDISKYIPLGGNGHILVTTRIQSVTEYATSGCQLRFRGLEPTEAIDFLLRSAYPNHEPETHPATPSRYHLARRIADELGYLPLALAHAAATIRKGIYTLEKYLHYYLGHRRRTICSPRVTSADEANIIATWEIPFQKIARRRTVEHKDAVDLMHILAFMHFESIPEAIFTRSWLGLTKTNLPPQECPDILQTVWNEEAQSRFRRAIQILCDHSIIDHEASKLSCSMHPVIHSWARDRLPESAQRQWLRCTMTVLAECISPSLEASGRQFRATLTPHINSCLQAFKAQFHTWPETLENAEIFERFAWVYAEQGTWKTARFWQQKVVDIRMKQLGRRHAQTVFAQSTLARTLWNLFEIGPAIELQLRVLHTLRWQRPSIKEWLAWPPWKPIHTPYCLALADITLTFWLAGKRQRSKQMGERAVDGLTKRLGPDDPKTLNAMFNLARTYLHIGEQEKSRELLVRVLRIQKHFFGLEHPDTMMTRNELGINLCASRRNLPIAERLIKNVYEARKKVLGEEHAYTLWSINDLSKVYMARGHVSKAVPMLEDTLSTAIRTLGDDHVGTSMTRSNLARGYFMMEKWEQAEELIRPSLQNTPQNHPDWVHNMYGYAQIKFNLGALDEAEQQCNIMLDVISKTKILGIHDSRTVAIADLLLSIYRLEGREKDIIAIKSKVPGTESTKNEDRYDPYAIRRSSHSSPAPKKKGKVAFVEAQPGNVEGERHRKSDAGFFQRERESRADEAASRTRPQLLSRRTF